LAGAGEDEAPHPAVGIDHTLEVGEELRDALDFIEDGAIRDLAKECTGVLLGEGAGVWIFEREVWEIRSEEARERGFSRLPRAGDGENRETRKTLTRCLRHDAWDRLVKARRGAGFGCHD